MAVTSPQHAHERHYPVATDVLYKALGEVLSAGPYKKPVFEDFTGSATFQTGATVFAPGHQWTAMVTKTGNGSTLTLIAAPAKSQALRLTDHSAKRIAEIATRLLADVSARCAAAVD